MYDFCFEKKASGQWIDWMDTIDKSKAVIPKDAKVRTKCSYQRYNGMDKGHETCIDTKDG